jgi:Predicted membrane protein (DUF2207)
MHPMPLALLAENRFLHVAQVALIYAGSVAAALWLAVVAALRVARAPERPEEAGPTMDLGPEPPAVANMLTNRWKPTPDAVPATLLDLAARGYVELQQVAPGQFQCRIRRDDAGDLHRFERRVMEHLRSKAELGVVPTAALTTGPADAADRWWKAFRGEVVAEAKARGLSEDLWDARSRAVVTAAAVPAGVLFGIAVPFWGAVYFVFAAAAILGWLWGGGRQRSTPAGLQAASRWLGVREHLRQDSVFDTAPPTAVAVWERYLGYGAALGEAAGAVRPIAMGAESARRAWSPVGGRWRQVRVVYPGNVASPGWGRSPAAVVALSLLAGVAAGLLLWVAVQLDDAAATSSAEEQLRAAEAALVVVGGLIAVGAAVQLVRGAIDLFVHREVTGLVLRARRQGSNEKPQLYLAVDDGSTDRIRAFRVRSDIYNRASEGDFVTASFSPNLRHVRALSAGPPPPPASGGPTSASER